MKRDQSIEDFLIKGVEEENRLDNLLTSNSVKIFCTIC